MKHSPRGRPEPGEPISHGEIRDGEVQGFWDPGFDVP